MILDFLRGSKRWFVVSTVSALCVSLCDLLTPQIVRFTVDAVIGKENPNLPAFLLPLLERIGGADKIRSHFWLIPAAVLLVALFTILFKYLFTVCNTHGAETLVKQMRDMLFSHIEHLPFSWHMRNQTGDIIQRCTSDVETVKRFLSEQLTQVFRTVAMLVLSLFFLFQMNTTLAIVAAAAIPVIFIYSLLFHKRIAGAFAECDENEGALSAIAQENLTGVRVVRAFGREKYERDRFEAQNQKYCTLWVRLSRTFSVFWGSADLISGIQQMLILVIGAAIAVRGELTAGEYIAFLSYNSMLIWPVRNLGRMIANLSKASVSLGRIYQILSVPAETDKPNALTPDFHGKDIRFEHVSFAYDGCPELLHDINVEIKAGSTVGILGGTGSGKSTLIHLLDRLYPISPDCGRITIGGIDIADMKADWIRRNIGIVLQEPYLFSRSLADNIAITEKNAGIEKIRAASATAALEETIDGFTDGFDTFVGERGVTLSGGQKQRAAIARMLMQETPIMVFDDSMSALDTETDAKIRHALREKLGDATVILVSHRITTLMQADKILVLENGRLTEEGTHAELIRSGGLYAKVYELQSSRDKETESGVTA